LRPANGLDAAVYGGREAAEDQVDGVVVCRSWADDVFIGESEYVVLAVPAAHVVGAELGGLRALGVTVQGLGEGYVEVEGQRRAAVGAAEVVEHEAVAGAVQDAFAQDVVADVEGEGDGVGDQGGGVAVGGVALSEHDAS